MRRSRFLPATCELHGKPTKRETCRRCNAAYMRAYLRGRRVLAPELTIWQRAHRRAASKSLPFAISVQEVSIPKTCPVLGIPISLGQQRSDNSPSLDRIIPEKGYVPGNVRVISDRANRLKSDRSLAQLKQKAASGINQFQEDYELIANYVERERLLDGLRKQAATVALDQSDRELVIDLLERIFGRVPDISRTHVEPQLTLAMIEMEFGLTKREVLLLRRRGGFPRPQRKRDGFRFVRADVEEWIAAQPDPAEPARILKRAAGTPRRCVGRVTRAPT